MDFSTTLCLSLTSFFLGGGILSLFCIVFGKLASQKYMKSRLSMLFILLGIAMMSFSAVFIIKQDFIKTFSMSKNDIIFLASIFATGILCAKFWKIVLPLFILLYIALTTILGLTLYKIFGTDSESENITITANAVMVGKKQFDMPGNIKDEKLVLDVYILPEKLLVPLPRTWFKIKGLSSTQENASGENFGIAEKMLLARKTVRTIDFPEISVTPALLKLNCIRKTEDISFQLQRSF